MEVPGLWCILGNVVLDVEGMASSTMWILVPFGKAITLCYVSQHLIILCIFHHKKNMSTNLKKMQFT